MWTVMSDEDSIQVNKHVLITAAPGLLLNRPILAKEVHVHPEHVHTLPDLEKLLDGKNVFVRRDRHNQVNGPLAFLGIE